ncbi:MAG: hypothetical protein KGQ41_04680 [Alphaproteobacteria bacterium]|nr:hypothetical protein [Alphaproteobacteria bacterium]
MLVAIPSVARAQEGGGFALNDVAMASIDFEEAFASIENGFLSDMIKLNYQISLLEKMVERQAELQKISDSFKEMGAHFNQPPPPRGICAQLPPNAACVKFYPDLYPEIVGKRRAYFEEMKARAAAANPKAASREGESEAEKAARLAKEEAERMAAAEKAERKVRYQWTDISCLLESCRGVLIGVTNPGYRATVRTGSVLADGTRVTGISKDGIVVNIAGDTINVRPAPEDDSDSADSDEGDGTASASLQNVLENGVSGAPASSNPATAGASSMASAIVGNASGGASGTPPTSDVPASAASTTGGTTAAATEATTGAAGQTVAEPALGPSGLF